MGFVTTTPGRGALGPGNMLPPNLDWGDFFKFMTAPHTSWPPNPLGQASPQPGQGSNVFKLPDQSNQNQGFQASDPGGQSPDWTEIVNWLTGKLGGGAGGMFGGGGAGGGFGSQGGSGGLSMLGSLFSPNSGIYSK